MTTFSEKVYARGGVVETGDGTPGGTISNSVIATNSKSGGGVPGYSSKIARHEDASSAYSARYHNNLQSAQSSGAWWHDFQTGKFKQAYGVGFGLYNLTVPTAVPSRPEIDDKALKKLKGKLSRDQENFKALVPLAELKETRSLIRSTAKATSELLIALIELKRGRVRNLVSKAGKAWLQFSFAISPTISDTNNLVNAIGSYLTKNDYAAKFTGSAEDMWLASSGTSSLASGCTGTNWRYTPWRQIHNYKVRYTAGVIFDLASGNNYSIPDHFGLSFGELIPTAWELVPFSWVADYFGTMGAFLEDVFSSDAGNTYYVTKSVKYELKQSQSGVLVKSSGIYNPLGSAWSQGFDSVLFDRTVLGSIPHRQMRIKTLDEIGVNSVNRLLNLASILASGSKPRR